MSYDAHDQWKIGRYIVENVVGSLRDRMKEYLDKYRETGNEDYLKEIITYPERKRSRLNNCISEFDTELGGFGGQALMVDCVNAYGTISASDLEEELLRLESQANTLMDRLGAGETWSQISDRIESALIKGPLQKIREYTLYEPNFIDMFGNNRRPV